jgi:hypothetical protein
MPTNAQIDAATLLLTPQPYNAAASKLTADAQIDLLVRLQQYLYDTKKSGGYTQLATRIDATIGRKAAILQAVLTNVGSISKPAQLTGEVVHDTEVYRHDEMEFALFVMYTPVPINTAGTSETEIGRAVRALFAPCGHLQPCGCSGNSEWQRTRYW